MKSQFVSLPDLPEEEQERLYELRDKLKYKIIEIKVKIGDSVEYNQVVATYGVFMKDVSVWKDKIRSKKTGKIKRVSVSTSSKVKPGYVSIP